MNADRDKLVSFRITKAKEILEEVNLHVQNKLWNTAVNRTYYACYHAVTALLAFRDINAKTHAGARTMFGLHFIKPGILGEEYGDFYSSLFDMRQSADYEDFFEYEEGEVLKLIQPASDFYCSYRRNNCKAVAPYLPVENITFMDNGLFSGKWLLSN
jgi:uncharacterized protein (UPF0332 family)